MCVTDVYMWMYMYDSVRVHVIVCLNVYVIAYVGVAWGHVCVRAHVCSHVYATTAAMRYKVSAVSSWVGGTGTLSLVRTLQIR